MTEAREAAIKRIFEHETFPLPNHIADLYEELYDAGYADGYAAGTADGDAIDVDACENEGV